MPNSCPLLRELDAWFSLALDILGGSPEVRRDVLLMVGGAATAAEAASVTAADCEPYDDHLVVYPPASRGRSFPLTAAYVQATGLSRENLPVTRLSPEADAIALECAVETVDAAMERLSGVRRPGGVDRIRLLRMHAWQHELGPHVGVLSRFYGGALVDLLVRGEDCATTRQEREVASLIPTQRRAHVTAVA